MIHATLCGLLTVFFSWLLLHALIYSKSDEGRIIEGLEPAVPTAAPTAAPTAVPTGTPIKGSTDENTAQLAILKKQIASLVATATQLNTDTLKNETGIKNNTEMIQKVIQSQTAANAKLAGMKKAQ
jgi:hypothetical protein